MPHPRSPEEMRRRGRLRTLFADGAPRAVEDVARSLHIARGTAARYIDLAIEEGIVRRLPDTKPARYVQTRSFDTTRPLAECFGLVPVPLPLTARFVRGTISAGDPAEGAD